MFTILGHKGNANQNAMLRFHLTSVGTANIKNTNNNKCWQGLRGKRNLHTLLLGM
jgi:hypothetical protein